MRSRKAPFNKFNDLNDFDDFKAFNGFNDSNYELRAIVFPLFHYSTIPIFQHSIPVLPPTSRSAGAALPTSNSMPHVHPACPVEFFYLLNRG